MKKIYLYVVLMAIIAVILLILLIPGNEPLAPKLSSCQDLGCNESDYAVGSLNSDIYHPCHCASAKLINPENIVCFGSAEDAENNNYRRTKNC